MKTGFDLSQSQRHSPEALARSLELVGCFTRDHSVEPVLQARHHSSALQGKLQLRHRRQRLMPRA